MQKTRPTVQDLQKAEKKLTRVVSKHVQLQRRVTFEVFNSFVKRRSFSKYMFVGNPLDMQAALAEKGFDVVATVLAEEQVVRFTKTFDHKGLRYTARVVAVPQIKSVSVSVCTETPPEVFK